MLTAYYIIKIVRYKVNFKKISITRRSLSMNRTLPEQAKEQECKKLHLLLADF